MNLSIMGKRNFRTRVIPYFMVLGTLLTFVVFIGGNAGAEPPTVDDILAYPGCAMAHCNQGMTDNNQLQAALSGGVVDYWRDTEVNGSLVGVGCVANHNTAVCTFRSNLSKPIEIRAYDIDGVPLWDSTELTRRAFYSAPIIGPDGGVIAADRNRIMRFNPDGSTEWLNPTAGGDPISPNVTDDGHIILATLGGPVSAYDYTTGALIAQISLEDTVRVWWRMLSGFFDTINTPAIKGNRIYISTEFNYDGWLPANVGRLYALDLEGDDSAGYSLEIAWYYQFRSPSGTSPTLGTDETDGHTIIYFDGSGLSPSSSSSPRAIAVKDFGDYGDLLWSYPLSPLPQSSPALDPRGGIWYFAFGSSELVRIAKNGDPIQTIDVNAIVDDDTDTFRPFSVMTISEDAESGHPVMMVAATNSNNSVTYATAIDLEVGSLLWKYRIGDGFYGGVSGQFAMLTNEIDEPVIIFTTRGDGVWGLDLRKLQPE